MPYFRKLSKVWPILSAFVLLSLLLLSAASAAEGASPLHADSPLCGKTALFCGDSICTANNDHPETLRWGWSGRIAKDYGMDCTNGSRIGASISDIRGANTVLAQVQSAKQIPYDFIILQGGTNDGWDSAPVGEISDKTEFDDFDSSTFAGGLERLFCYTKSRYPKARIGFLINYRTPIQGCGRLDDMREYYAVARQICDKWEIPYLDLYSDENFNRQVLQVSTGRYTSDIIHLNGDGYDKITPYVAAFMEKMVTGENPNPPTVALSADKPPLLPAVVGVLFIGACLLTGLLLPKSKKARSRK